MFGKIFKGTQQSNFQSPRGKQFNKIKERKKMDKHNTKLDGEYLLNKQR